MLRTCWKEQFDSTLHELWDRCNVILLSWIMNIASKELVSIVIYRIDNYSVWEDLKERFDNVSTSRAFYFHKEIATLTKGIFSVAIYFSKLRKLWDELGALIPPPSCPYPEIK